MGGKKLESSVFDPAKILRVSIVFMLLLLLIWRHGSLYEGARHPMVVLTTPALGPDGSFLPFRSSRHASFSRKISVVPETLTGKLLTEASMKEWRGSVD